jgi:hypothetical protein
MLGSFLGLFFSTCIFAIFVNLSVDMVKLELPYMLQLVSIVF